MDDVKVWRPSRLDRLRLVDWRFIGFGVWILGSPIALMGFFLWAQENHPALAAGIAAASIPLMIAARMMAKRGPRAP